MKRLRRLELALVVMMLMLVHIAPPAYADGYNASVDFANSLLQYFGY